MFHDYYFRLIALFKWKLIRLKHITDFQFRRAVFLLSIIPILVRTKDLRSALGLRFLELKFLLTKWLDSYLEINPEGAREICSHFENVLGNCDSITYDDDGSAEAYVILHFLDRFHRFQMIFETLRAQNAFPLKRPTRVLDIGTGPGPSMFAASDHFKGLSWRFARDTGYSRDLVMIDYAERSHGFRSFLHHFTELANGYAPSGMPWEVPYHQGTTFDFANIDFNMQGYVREWHEDGCRITPYVKKVRPDLIIMSNFLTTQDQAQALIPQIKDCARHLRHGGILLIVGARSDNEKYRPVYSLVEEAVLGTNYSKRQYKAWCKKLNLGNGQFAYNYNDAWGAQIKRFLSDVQGLLRRSLGPDMPSALDEKLSKWSSLGYAHEIKWEVRAYRKVAIPRYRRAAIFAKRLKKQSLLKNNYSKPRRLSGRSFTRRP